MRNKSHAYNFAIWLMADRANRLVTLIDTHSRKPSFQYFEEKQINEVRQLGIDITSLVEKLWTSYKFQVTFDNANAVPFMSDKQVLEQFAVKHKLNVCVRTESKCMFVSFSSVFTNCQFTFEYSL